MAEFPAIPIWTDAYLADTLDLEDSDHGLYLLMLMLAWRRPDCALPDDMQWLKRALQACCAGLHGHTFNTRVPRILRRFWTLEKDGQNIGKWVQKRLQKERKYLQERSQKQRKRALERWENKHLANASAMQRGNAPTPTPTPTLREEVDTTTESNIERPEKLSLFVEHTKTPPAVRLNGHSHHDFAEWWQRYPRKVGKLACATKYAGIVRRREATAEQLAAGLERYIATKPSTQDWCHPLTWLNQGRWTDEGQKTQSDIAQDWFNAQQRGSA